MSNYSTGRQRPKHRTRKAHWWRTEGVQMRRRLARVARAEHTYFDDDPYDRQDEPEA